jgi:hypothetical protein
MVISLTCQPKGLEEATCLGKEVNANGTRETVPLGDHRALRDSRHRRAPQAHDGS